MLRCPVCRSPLARQCKSYRCGRGHRFDVARSGYVNLLGTGTARPRGDEPEMLRNRRAFLEAGWYRQLQDAITGRVTSALGPAAPSLRLLDVGCGEGYYTGALASALPAGSEAWGIDISRRAIEMAARRHPEARFAVAAARDLPIEDASVEVLVSIFGPYEPAEFGRVLKGSGRAIIVRPGADHLVEWRRRLYRELRAPGRREVSPEGGWRSVERFELRYCMALGEQDRERLLAMTPYAWAGGEYSRQAIITAPEAVTAHFLIFELGQS